MTQARALSDKALHLILGWSAFALIGAEFVLIPMRTRVWFPNWAGTLNPFIWWAVGLLVIWVLVPGVMLRGTGGLAFSIALPKTARGLGLYAALILLMLPALFIAGQRPDFQTTYPLLHPVEPLVWSGGLLAAYWLCYATILFATEFFFRGVLLFSLEQRLGTAAIAVSVLPYCLIHAHKPLPEAFGSIVAGYVLGYLALRTRSIGGGVLVHCAVAFGMDALALVQRGALPFGG